jgi:hypothetical protein
MTNLASLTVLFSLSIVAGCAAEAAPALASPSRPAASRPECDASGEVLFEIDHELGTQPATPQSADILYANGGWHSTTAKGKSITGCLTDAELATLRHDVDSPWRIEPLTGAACHAMTLDRTVYKVRGKTVWTAQGCARNQLDATSATSLRELEQVIATATARPAAAPR